MIPMTLSADNSSTPRYTHAVTLHRWNASHWKTACSAVSGVVPHSEHAVVVEFPNLARFSLKHPCPVSSWLR
ncbi:unnamed protein product [Macrosiphum euphorbiae]|uniref:Uncharacterized protein n=1 Tax=Macrosiphum euphorbiae TaxID=13131 RepID=A0AAV0WD72_9HEMI|nr:unnamed protein product [Macrosiphum euphorbiae]